jgi:hypothetical protein
MARSESEFNVFAFSNRSKSGTFSAWLLKLIDGRTGDVFNFRGLRLDHQVQAKGMSKIPSKTFWMSFSMVLRASPI